MLENWRVEVVDCAGCVARRVVEVRMGALGLVLAGFFVGST